MPRRRSALPTSSRTSCGWRPLANALGSSAQSALTSDLMFGEGSVRPIALAPAVVPTRPAVGDPAIAMPNDALRRELVTALTHLERSRFTWCAPVRRQAKVVEIDAAG